MLSKFVKNVTRTLDPGGDERKMLQQISMKQNLRV
jgi:hypothetical protein